ncbi:hypothetical protein [Sphingomonas colocasiae]|uniref:Uncharacterized protein n=1 Tax=Sphingomonas colocasiae TaxID=1848973 RepID=A0ABS7PUJ1_9SPHN|nr:hypothetical protein [Sphingomonas colocasiae]MBY8825025.1 hypothetical protein [Sphingomonas colocasiae]
MASKNIGFADEATQDALSFIDDDSARFIDGRSGMWTQDEMTKPPAVLDRASIFDPAAVDLPVRPQPAHKHRVGTNMFRACATDIRKAAPPAILPAQARRV